jgi:hypothetical protein
MATFNSDASVRFDSWVSFYAVKARVPAGALQVLTKSKLSILEPLPSDHANDKNKFKTTAATWYPYGNFLIIPSRGQNIRIVYHCFVHGDPGSPPVVVGISGTRRMLPFKMINSSQHAVALITRP